MGYYLPWIVACGLLTAISCGLVSTLSDSSGSGKWIGYQIIMGFGRGIGFQMVRFSNSTLLIKNPNLTETFPPPFL